MPNADREAGFTVVEALVAFAITALGLIWTLETVGSVTGGMRRLEAQRAAIDEAESIVLLRAAETPLAPGIRQGRFSDGTAWILSVADARPAPRSANLPPLWRIRLVQGGLDGRDLYTTLMPGDVRE